MKHVLVIGGTGMLLETTLWLQSTGYHVSVIGRDKVKMNALLQKCHNTPHITPLLVDYHDSLQLKEHLIHTSLQNGPIELVVAWVHSSALEAMKVITETVAQFSNNWKLFHILSSGRNLVEVAKQTSLPKGCLYKQIQLGFIVTNTTSRWLTNEEISKGVIKAIKKEQPISIVGVIEPKSKRP